MLSQHPDTKMAAAANPGLPPAAQMELARRDDQEIREGLAWNRSLDPDAAWEIASPLARTRPITRGRFVILRYLSYNPAAPASLLDAMAYLRQPGTQDLRQRIARNPATGDSTLEHMAMWDKYGYIRDEAVSVLARRAQP
jgi:hypothetical protein